MTSTAIVAQHAFEPSDGDAAYEMAKRLVASRLLPKSVTTPEAAFAIIVTGRELGMTAMQSLRGIHIIEGKPVLSADTMLALALRSPHCEWFRVVESTNDVATLETKRRSAPEPARMSFTSDDAKLAGLLGKDNWRKYPAAMLRARAIAALARSVYPDIFMGVYEQDEIPAPAAEPVRVRSTVVKATPRAPAPEPAKAEEPAGEAPQDLEDAIADAGTLDTLAVVGKAINARKATLSAEMLATLKAAYQDRRQAILAASAKATATTAAEVAADAIADGEVAA